MLLHTFLSSNILFSWSLCYFHIWINCVLSKMQKLLYQIYTIVDIIIWNFETFKLSSDLPKVKQCLISSITNIVNKITDKPPNSLRGRSVENYERLKKNENWIETEPRAQPTFHEQTLGNSGQTICKIISQSLILLSFCSFCSKYFPWDCLSENILTRTCPALTKGTIFRFILKLESFSKTCNTNIKQVSGKKFKT